MSVSASAETVEITQQNAVFVTQDQPEDVNYAITPRLDVALNPSLDIGLFLARPVEIYTNTTDTWSILPYNLLLSNTAISNKLANFFMMRASIVLRIEVSANPYIYGRCAIGIWGGNNPYNVALKRTFNNYSILQSDYHVDLDYAVHQSVQLKIPYINGEPYFVIANQFPDCVVSCVNILSVADALNSATPTITYRVYAWFEDVQLSAPVTQSKFETTNVKETKMGPISGLASKFEAAGNILSKIPVIGGYFGLFGNISGLVGKAAAIFGLSRPSYINNDDLKIIKYNGNMCNTTGVDVSRNLSLDPKRFKTISNIDASVEDQLSFSYIGLHWGVLGLANITTSDAVGTLYIGYPVMPCAGPTYSSNTSVALPPVGFVTAPFAQWHGSLEYRFTVICSKFHKGRVRIFWNPYYNPTVQTGNLTLLQYLDIVPGNTATMIVPYARESMVLQSQIWNIDVQTGMGSDAYNGFIHVVLDMPLSAPRAGAGCSILVEVRAGPDFSVFEPTMTNIECIDVSSFGTQTYYFPCDNSTDGIYPYGPGPVLVTDLKPALQTSSLPTNVNEYSSEYVRHMIGERCVSFRSLLKRYYYFGTDYITTLPPFVTEVLRRTPAWGTEIESKLYVNSVTMLQYASLPFIANTGSTRVKVVPTLVGNAGGNPFNSNIRSVVMRGVYDSFARLDSSDHVTSTELYATQLFSRRRFGAGGDVSPIGLPIEVSIPDTLGFSYYPTGAADDLNEADAAIAIIYDCNNVPTGTNFAADIFYAAGDDFNLSGFVGVPLLYFNMPSYT